ncbi:HNH endonuclease [Alcaligenes pakistanensis]|uniref:HNH endonuclease n=1 Tax=Alcaligenes pakistanensis TaxID=1482717 RepID=UPI001671CB8A
MAKTSLQKARARAFKLQNGCCFYCGQRMNQSPITKCTAEHLQARSEGGGVVGNIVAACWYCNNHRHRSRIPMVPEAWQVYVGRKVQQKRWPTLT